jgi:hypothetical protein
LPQLRRYHRARKLSLRLLSKLASAGLSANGNGNYTIITPGTSSGVVFQGIGNVATSNGSWPTLTCSVTASGNTIAIVN